MSTLLLAATDTMPLAADDVFGTVNGLMGKGTTTVVTGVSLLGMIFVVRHIISSFTIVRLLSALLMGGLMIWGVVHLTDISGKVNNTVNGGGGSSTSDTGGTGGTPATPAPTTMQLGQGHQVVLPLD
ncbi:MAG: hypothetical protein INR66_06720 [Gordonia polyisoprenivorans]|nr:hypothetical protein [Gordonia polyisoprenivorans]